MPSKRKSQQDQVYWYSLLAAGVVILALAGYSGYVLYPRFDLPAVTGVGLLLLAAAASVAASFVAFVVAVGVITLLALGLAAAITAAQERLVGTMRAGVTQVKQWGGVILILVGTWFLILAIGADFFAQIFPV